MGLLSGLYKLKLKEKANYTIIDHIFDRHRDFIIYIDNGVLGRAFLDYVVVYSTLNENYDGFLGVSTVGKLKYINPWSSLVILDRNGAIDTREFTHLYVEGTSSSVNPITNKGNLCILGYKGSFRKGSTKS